MKTFKKSIKMFKYNASSILLFEVIYKLLSAVVLIPALYAIINSSIRLSGIRYLNLHNLKKLFLCPSTYAFLFLAFLLISYYFFVHISGLIYAMDASNKGIKTNPLFILVRGFINSFRILNPKNVSVIFYVLLLLPWTYSVIITGTIFGFRLPEFMYDVYDKYQALFIGIIAAYFLLCVLMMFRVLSVNYFTVYKMNYKEAVYHSKKTIRKHMIKILGGTLLYNALLAILLLGMESLIAGGVVKILSLFISYKRLKFIVSNVINVIIFIFYAIFSVLSTPLVYSYICACFYSLEDDEDAKKDKRIFDYEQLDDANKKQHRKTYIAVFLLSTAIVCFYYHLKLNNKMNLNIAYANKPSVTAHRGDSSNAPENTMPAFAFAKENQADIVELDVRQTKDGEYVVIHDESLSRTTGIHGNVGDYDLEYIRSLDAGSLYSDEYKGEKIPTFEEVLQYAKENDIFLNIELKPAKTDSATYVDGIVDLINEYEYEDDCMLASSELSAIKKVKELNPKLKTLYIMYMVIGEVKDYDYVDGFSIRRSFISVRVVKEIHKLGKEIYAWTVNDEYYIKDMLLLNVDGIITDNPYNTKDIVDHANDSLISDWLKRLVKEY